jgi:hypothetical protein
MHALAYASGYLTGTENISVLPAWSKTTHAGRVCYKLTTTTKKPPGESFRDCPGG